MLTRSSARQSTKTPSPNRKAYLPLAIAIGALAVVLWFSRGLDPAWRLIAAAGVGYVLFKSAAIVGPQRSGFLSLSGRARIFFSLPWPGFDPRRFIKKVVYRPARDRLVGGALRMTAGGLAVVLASLSHESWGDTASWVGIGGILLLVHLGYAYVLTWVAQRAGYPVRPLFDDRGKADR